MNPLATAARAHQGGSLANKVKQSESCLLFTACNLPLPGGAQGLGPLSWWREHRLQWHNQNQCTFSTGTIYFQASVRSLLRDENHSVNCLLLSSFGGPFGINIKVFCIFIIPPSALSKDIWQAHKSSIVSTWTLKRHQQVQTQVENSLK